MPSKTSALSPMKKQNDSVHGRPWCFPCLIVLLAWQNSYAEELFEKNQPTALGRGASVSADSTIGGYPIYPGDKQWRFASSEVDGPNNMGVSYGSATLLNPDSSGFFVQMQISANLNQTSTGFYMTNEPCGGEHLVKVNHVRGMGGEGVSGNCLTIDPFVATVNGKQITTLDLRITNSQSSSRYYEMRIFLNPIPLGLGESVPNDWSKDALARNPDRSKFLGRVTEWGKQLQSGVDRAIGFSKPKDAFSNVGSFQDLR